MECRLQGLDLHNCDNTGCTLYRLVRNPKPPGSSYRLTVQLSSSNFTNQSIYTLKFIRCQGLIVLKGT